MLVISSDLQRGNYFARVTRSRETARRCIPALSLERIETPLNVIEE